MKIPRLELRAVKLPLRPFTTAAGTLESREGFLVFTEDGGVGEAMPLPSSGTETLGECREVLEGAEGFELDELNETPCARFAIETALLDAEAKRKKVPLARVLDAEPISKVPVNALIDARSDAAPPGFRSYKLKVGTPGDIARAQRIRQQIGPDAELRLDANGTWSLSTAIEALNALEAANPSYCEDPLADPGDVSALRAHTHVAIAADAWLADPKLRTRIIEEHLADVLVLKPAVIGGLVRSQQLAFQARARGMSVVVTTMLEGVVGRLAALHLAAALPTQAPAGLATGYLLASDHAADPAPVREGFMFLPAAHGLGVEVPR